MLKSAIVGTPYPSPDRSDFEPNLHRDDRDLPERDHGASTGTFPDHRPYRVEGWNQEGLELVTYFFSVVDLESASPDQLLEYVRPVLERARVPEDRRTLTASGMHTIVDASGHRMFSLTFIIAAPE